jgi:hypothetical protein
MPGNGSFALRRPGWRVWVAGGLALVVLVVVLAARLSGGGEDPRERAGSAPATSTAAPAVTASGAPGSTASAAPSTTAPGGVDADGGFPSETPPPASGPAGVSQASQTALALVRAMVDHSPGMTQARWWAAVSRYADPTLGEQLKLTDPATVPANRVTGAPQVMAGGGSGHVQVAVPTDGGRVLVTCVFASDRWLASDLDLERGPA